MPDDTAARLAAIRSRAAYLAAWLDDNSQTLPSMVRHFLTLDVPTLLALTESIRHQPASTLAAVEAPAHLAEVLHLIRLAAHAAEHGSPIAAAARQSDVREALDRLQPYQLRNLAEEAVRALADTGWRVDRPNVPWLAPEAHRWEPGS